MASFGTCYQSDFRFFTMLRQEGWNDLRWESMGNAVQEHRDWNHWPYEQRLRVLVNDADIASSVQVDQIEQQMDFRKVQCSSPFAAIDRLDFMVSGRQWITSLRLLNPLSSSARVVVDLEWTEKDRKPLSVRRFEQTGTTGFIYSTAGGPPTVVSLGQTAMPEVIEDRDTVRSRWSFTLQPGQTIVLSAAVHIGWDTMPKAEERAIEDQAPGRPASDAKALVDRDSDWQGFGELMRGLGVSAVGEDWDTL